jgi:hypothetical protein
MADFFLNSCSLTPRSQVDSIPMRKNVFPHRKFRAALQPPDGVRNVT